jgi:hypothetical protein
MANSEAWTMRPDSSQGDTGIVQIAAFPAWSVIVARPGRTMMFTSRNAAQDLVPLKFHGTVGSQVDWIIVLQTWHLACIVQRYAL